MQRDLNRWSSGGVPMRNIRLKEQLAPVFGKRADMPENEMNTGRLRLSDKKAFRPLVLALVLILVLIQIGPFFSADNQIASALAAAGEIPIYRQGIITATSANIRSTPDSSQANIIGPVYKNSIVDVDVRVTGNVTSYGDQWYRITVNGITGYMVTSFVKFLNNTKTDSTLSVTDFEAYMNDQGFPESYKTYIRQLHALYPNWIFEALHTGLDWATVVEQEHAIGKSLINNAYNDAWKSTDSAVNAAGVERIYNWTTDQWTIQDGSTWVMASRGLIAYFMDPRNAMVVDSTGAYRSVFQFLRLDKYNAAAPAENSAGVKSVLDGSFMWPAGATDTTYVDAFIQAANNTVAGTADNFGVNPYHLASRSRQEVGSAGSSSVRGTFSFDRLALGISDPNDAQYNGFYNFYNIGAYSSTEPLGNVKNGLIYAKDHNWNSPTISIIEGAGIVSTNYVKKLQYTVYYQKFNVIDNYYNSYFGHQYMGALEAPTSEAKMLYKAYAAAGDINQTLRFSIPVYLNMPETASSLPAESGNPNNWLNGLNINGQSLTPTFSPANTDGYMLIVEGEVSTAVINLGTASAKSTASVNGVAVVNGTASIPLNVGDNAIAITVTAQNGSTRTYNARVVRKDPGAPPTLVTQSFSVNADNSVSGINPLTAANQVQQLIAQLASSSADYQVIIVKADGSPFTADQLAGTGSIIKFIRNGYEASSQYRVIIYGDSTGDGEINTIDMNVIYKHILNRSLISSYYLTASDANHDGEVNTIDLNLIYKHILSRLTISQ